ncbi:MAG TPA: hypothetical protein VG962_09225 [Steroidobacteraceae bacterium]|nr:hypothetical protein [Steroidobacteraceae bacterium]
MKSMLAEAAEQQLIEAAKLMTCEQRLRAECNVSWGLAVTQWELHN